MINGPLNPELPRTLEQAQANRAKLIAALRSGKYEQGTGALKKVVNGIAYYCCQGVGCELIAHDRWTTHPDAPDNTTPLWFVDGDGELKAAYWPEPVRLYYGVSRADSGFLAKLNDAHKSFSYIARQLEHLPYVVKDNKLFFF